MKAKVRSQLHSKIINIAYRMINRNEIKHQLIDSRIDCKNGHHFPKSIIYRLLNWIIITFHVNQWIRLNQGICVSFPVLENAYPLFKLVETYTTYVF